MDSNGRAAGGPDGFNGFGPKNIKKPGVFRKNQAENFHRWTDHTFLIGRSRSSEHRKDTVFVDLSLNKKSSNDFSFLGKHMF